MKIFFFTVELIPNQMSCHSEHFSVFFFQSSFKYNGSVTINTSLLSILRFN